MKTIYKVGLLAVIVIAALAFTGFAYANSNGAGMRHFLSGTYKLPAYAQDCGDCDGILHEYIQEAWAAALGLEESELEELLDSGLTHYQIVLDLGVVETQDEFLDLLREVMDTAVANALADGVLTAEHAQVMLQHMNQMGDAGMLGHMNEFGGMKMRGEGAPFGPLSYQSGLMEEFLGLTREQFRARIQNGETIQEILTSQGKTLEEWSACSLAAQTARLNAAVENGQLTREQADALILRMEERFENGWLEPLGPMGPFGVPGEGGSTFGMPGMHGPGGHHGPNITPPETGNGKGGNDG